MLSANADGLINAVGTYMAHCTFRNQSDDGFNSMGRGEFVNTVQGGAILHTGVGRGCDGELLTVFDPVRGVYRGNFHVKDIVFGDALSYKDGILTINKGHIVIIDGKS